MMAADNARSGRRWLKPALFALLLLPAVLLLADILVGRVGPNPVETVAHRTGDWALRWLLLVLAATPLRRLSGWVWPQRVRRMLGLFAFFYALLHFLTWLLLDQSLRWDALLDDVAKRPYITLGLAAFLMLVPLAITSTRSWMRRLGRRWQSLHRLVYPAAMLAVLHYLLLTKADLRDPLLYAGVLGLLLGYRLWTYGSRRWRKRATGRRPAADKEAGAAVNAYDRDRQQA